MEDFIAVVINIFANPFAISVVTGIVAGIISGVVVTRLSRFETLRSEAQRILRGLEYMSTSNGGVDITKGKPDTTILTHIAGDFYALGHQKAGNQVNQAISDINKVLSKPHNYTEITAADKEWQKAGRDLKPNFWAILRVSLTI